MTTPSHHSTTPLDLSEVTAILNGINGVVASGAYLAAPASNPDSDMAMIAATEGMTHADGTVILGHLCSMVSSLRNVPGNFVCPRVLNGDYVFIGGRWEDHNIAIMIEGSTPPMKSIVRAMRAAQKKVAKRGAHHRTPATKPAPLAVAPSAPSPAL